MNRERRRKERRGEDRRLEINLMRILEDERRGGERRRGDRRGGDARKTAGTEGTVRGKAAPASNGERSSATQKRPAR